MATDAELLAQAAVIKTETTPGANTATRVGEMFEAIVESKPGIMTWDMTTNTLPTGGKSGQEYYGTGVTTLTDASGNTLPLRVIAKALQDNPTTNAHFAFISLLY